MKTKPMLLLLLLTSVFYSCEKPENVSADTITIEYYENLSVTPIKVKEIVVKQ